MRIVWMCLVFLLNGSNTMAFRPPSPEQVNYFSFRGKTFQAVPCRVYDGDTFSSVFQYGEEWIKWRCRCLGYDAPEIRQPRHLSEVVRQEEKKKAFAARDRLFELLTRTDTIHIQCGDFDKYGRILVTVYSTGFLHESINDLMIRDGYGRPLL